MTQQRIPQRGPEPEPLVLVVDDDRRVRELLEIAFTAHGFKVITAVDGEEAIRRSHGDRPDLVILDVRLPKRSGLEVCEMLRHEADDPNVPIILVSAAAESETRLQGFSRGADDYLVKPFSPRELLARARRLLARSQEQRAARRKLLEAERDLARVGEESRRAQLEAQRARHLGEFALSLGTELNRIPDLDALVRRLLRHVRELLATDAAVLLVRDAAGSLAARAAIGVEFERASGLSVGPASELGMLLHGLARPVYRHTLDRLPELEADLRPFLSGRFDLIAPIRGEHGLEALIVIEEHPTGAGFEIERLGALDALCAVAAPALANSVRNAERARGLLDLLRDSAAPSRADLEAADLVARAARGAGLAPRWRELIERSVALGCWAREPRGIQEITRIAACDDTGFLRELAAVCERTAAPANPDATETESGAEERALALIRAGHQIAASRAAGTDLPRAVAFVLRESPSLPVSLRRALDAALEGAPEDVEIAPARRVRAS